MRPVGRQRRDPAGLGAAEVARPGAAVGGHDHVAGAAELVEHGDEPPRGRVTPEAASLGVRDPKSARAIDPQTGRGAQSARPGVEVDGDGAVGRQPEHGPALGVGGEKRPVRTGGQVGQPPRRAREGVRRAPDRRLAGSADAPDLIPVGGIKRAVDEGEPGGIVQSVGERLGPPVRYDPHRAVVQDVGLALQRDVGAPVGTEHDSGDSRQLAHAGHALRGEVGDGEPAQQDRPHEQQDGDVEARPIPHSTG